MKFNYLIFMSIGLSFLCQNAYCSENKHKDSHDNEDHIEKNLAHDSHEDEDGDGHSNTKAIGEGKAILEVDKERGFRLSKKAIKSLELQLVNITNSVLVIPKNALVVSKEIKGIYRWRDEYFKFIPLKNIKTLSSGYKITIKEVKKGDRIVIRGVSLLRVTDTYSTDKSEYGHAH